ncbi:XRE family transcriptional regulator [Salmonella bongori]|uniref:XRE family transcriptional regulator n=5 Tax=Salmonella enterica subsp. salamae TaxID=59202 RepID=A0A6C7D3M6_SALER|nr:MULTISPECIES: helix-turn-helix transcriptional regulator [Enterobacteriaceae]EAB9860157.1 XRE family transcriptional regulator [Salmonella enterica subsp. salamae]EAO9706069.1 XRE family transcriptional regulator [Salmonella enterica]EBI0478553.1 XRE family transcriptional regulator [Salmonella enterica subsp. enterica serovar Braenderup]ECC8921418.1 XRE family transcriptional regulator [Salmonella bongori]EDR0323076.1 helix-turn-helix transcriptional regulator [Salmonella enterica subsp. h
MTSVYSIEYQMVIKALREARVAGHITQEELGKALGRPQSFIAKVENGERRLDIIEFVHLCRLVGIDPVSIINKL